MTSRWQRVYERLPVFLQEAALSVYGRRLLRERFDPDFEARLGRLLEVERDSPEQHRAYQEQRLRTVVRRAFAHVPFHRRRMEKLGLGPDDVSTLEGLARLPVLSREEIHEHLGDMLAGDVRRETLLLGHTSGTTGSPLEFWWDRRVCVWNNLMLYRARAWAGHRFGDLTATLLGNVIVPPAQKEPPFWRACRPWNKIFFSSFHLERANLPAYAGHLRALGRVWLEAYPSTAYVLAQYLEEKNDTVPLRGVFLSSETLTAGQREVIERRFDCRVWDAYSMSERVIFSAECEVHAGQHLFPEFGIVEVLDGNDRPVPPGEPGRLVATGLQNEAMPLLRYDTGDVGGIDPRPCACGRSLARMLPITTKAEDVVVTPDGRFISSSVLTHPFKPMRNVAKSQLVQETPGRLLVRIVPREEYGEDDSRALVAGLRERLGEGIQIDLELVDDIPRTASGKYRWVISRVPLGLGSAAGKNLFGEEG